MRKWLAKLTDFDIRLCVTLTVFVLFLISFFVYVDAERAIDSANKKRLQSFLLADELRQSSDDLTRMVRTYAVTGEQRYRHYFDEIFAIRNGHAPKPENYHYIYWDLVDANNNRPRPFGPPAALLDSMRQVGFTDIELTQLVSAKQASDDLTNIEQRAMELVASGDPLLREQALVLLHNNEYHLAKAGIMRPIDDLYEMMNSRTVDAVRQAEISARWLRLVFVVLGVMLAMLLWQLKRRQLAILGAPVAELYSKIEALGNGDFTTDIVVPAGKDNTLLGWLSRTRHRLFLLEHTRMQVQQRLEHLAHYDPLTGLSNRVLLAEQLQSSMLKAAQSESLLAVAFVDIDGFKAVNDRYGHALGDQVLQTLSKRLVTAVGNDNIVARMSGDEFVFLLNTLSQVEDSLPLLQQALASLAEPVTISGVTVTLSASIGVSFYPQNVDVAAEQILRQADQAMYVAKQAGKNRFHLFDNEADQHTRIVLRSLNDIRDGLARQEFVLFYQPKVNMLTGECVGVEALVRWQHPGHGLMAPGQFLPLIEHHELGVQLGQWVISQAFRQYQIWQAQGVTTSISVNIAAFHLQQADFSQQLGAIFDAFPAVPPSMLELEIVETSALQDIAHVKQTMHACSAFGVTFSLDDFGTGYSSLSYLKRLPISTLKLDQSFVRDILTDADDLAILQGVSRLAEAFELATIAEGVETAAHMQKLLQIGYVFGQGYGIARPMPANAFVDWLSKWRNVSLS
ncbi:putative bifunctional diguanylate cyclase/phosphodiesterase [Arsukibacterium perlucidum]|uniref:putative bifunctional diguanylate cyclase/phosphodiesterase n=1 Tax=Arsukibacterium perlucidum TaxID=368811 RepID=UPI00036FB5B0|nr:EAL domain-containing protein [Arsukibacterium perlucidum]